MRLARQLPLILSLVALFLPVGAAAEISEADFDKRLLTATYYRQSYPADPPNCSTHAWVDETGQLLKVSLEQTATAGGLSRVLEYSFDANRLFRVQLDYFGAPEKVGAVATPRPSPGREALPTFPAALPLPADDAATQALELAAKLIAAGPPEADPAAGPAAEKYRLIMDSVSPDGHYALAFGLAQDTIAWKDFHDAKRGGYVIPDDAIVTPSPIRNYVVDLRTKKILGETGCRYARTRAQDDAHACYTVWSATSDTFVQTVAEPIGQETLSTCRLGRIVEGKLLPTLDLQKPAAQLARQATAGKGQESADKPVFKVLADGSNKNVSIEGDKVSLVGEIGDDLLEEYFTLRVAGGVVGLGTDPGTKPAEPMMGAAPAFAPPAMTPERQRQLEIIRKLLEAAQQ